jgi:acrylyl-CoA reductase (NADPH)
LSSDRLPKTDTEVAVHYSTLNFKDGLAITNKGPVVRLWPMVPGIDGAGQIIQSESSDWKQGDFFIHNG